MPSAPTGKRSFSIGKREGFGVRTQISYFISPHAQNTVRAAVFYIVDDEDNGVGVGVAVPQL
ncbi:TPA: hypothetical protein ACH3X3_008134 [Trebouxia sp. C0006]